MSTLLILMNSRSLFVGARYNLLKFDNSLNLFVQPTSDGGRPISHYIIQVEMVETIGVKWIISSSIANTLKYSIVTEERWIWGLVWGTHHRQWQLFCNNWWVKLMLTLGLKLSVLQRSLRQEFQGFHWARNTSSELSPVPRSHNSFFSSFNDN